MVLILKFVVLFDKMVTRALAGIGKFTAWAKMRHHHHHHHHHVACNGMDVAVPIRVTSMLKARSRKKKTSTEMCPVAHQAIAGPKFVTVTKFLVGPYLWAYSMGP